MDKALFDKAARQFTNWFDTEPAVAVFAPGRIEVLGNHTDYNEGFVLSAAIDLGTCFLAAPVTTETCRLVAADMAKEAQFKVSDLKPASENSWANYVKGVLAGLLAAGGKKSTGFNGLFLSNLPLAAGLSSSAALEMSSGLALSTLYGMDIKKLDLARIGQKAEHEYVGVKCGLLDQISSLFGKDGALVMTDFRSLEIRNIPLGGKQGSDSSSPCFVVCNTGVKHTLVDSEYNERRASCEKAAAFFKSAVDHPVAFLRDVSWDEWKRLSPRMDPVAAKRSAHIIGENTRVLRGAELLSAGKSKEFGRLMFESHESSRTYFENSCPELDFLVDTAKTVPGVLGARLSGGGFGGCALMLVESRSAEQVGKTLTSAYEKKFNRPCGCKAVRTSGGARLLT